MRDETDQRWTGEDAGVAERRDRRDGHVFGHYSLPAYAAEQDRHDIGATDPDQRIARQCRLPGWKQGRERETKRSAKAAEDDGVSAAEPLHDAIAGEPANR